MRHRGPDEPGTWSDDDVVFGFNRLSIIDIEHSHQPLRWGPPETPERYALVFNGEIYNYLEIREQLTRDEGAEFRTQGDGEAIVAAFHHWGPDAVSRLRGMFAFAIWDTVERSLLLARDPFGIKPLFIASGSGGTIFGSEKKSLLELIERIGVTDELDDRAIEHYTVLQYVPEPETLHGARRRGGEHDRAGGCHPDRLLVPDERIEGRGQHPEHGIRPAGVGERDGDGADGLGVRPVDHTPGHDAERPDAVAGPQEGPVPCDDVTQ